MEPIVESKSINSLSSHSNSDSPNPDSKIQGIEMLEKDSSSEEDYKKELESFLDELHELEPTDSVEEEGESHLEKKHTRLKTVDIEDLMRRQIEKEMEEIKRTIKEEEIDKRIVDLHFEMKGEGKEKQTEHEKYKGKGEALKSDKEKQEEIKELLEKEDIEEIGNVDELWEKYLTNAKDNLEEREEEEKKRKLSDSRRQYVNKEFFAQNPFLRQTFPAEPNNEVEVKRQKGAQINLPSQLLYAFILADYTIHKSLVSDYQLRRAQETYYHLLQNNPSNYDALLGMGKFHFYNDEFEKAIKYFEQRAEIKSKLWMGICYYYLFFTKQESKNTKKKHIKAIEKYFGDVLKQGRDNIALWGLLNLNIELKNQHNVYKIKQKFNPEDYCLEIKKNDEYLGYIAWCEIYFNSNNETTRESGFHVLAELTDFEKARPEAYLRYWRAHWENKNYEKCLDIAEKVFVYGTEFDSFEMKLLMVLIYGKSLFVNQQYIATFELFQHQYSLYTHLPALLYHYGRYVAMAKNEKFYGSALTAFEECLRSQLYVRRGDVLFWMGVIYIERREIIKAGILFEEALKYLNKSKQKKRKRIMDFLRSIEKPFQYIKGIERRILERGKIKPEKMKSEMQNIKSQLNVVIEVDRFYATLLNAVIAYKMRGAYFEAEKIFESLIQTFPLQLEGHLEYWAFLKERQNIPKMVAVCKQMIESCSSTHIPTNQWVCAHIAYAKTLGWRENYEEAINTLKQLCRILPPLPIPELNFINTAIEIDNPFLRDDPNKNEELPDVEDVEGNYPMGVDFFDNYEDNVVVENRISIISECADFFGDEYNPEFDLGSPVSSARRISKKNTLRGVEFEQSNLKMIQKKMDRITSHIEIPMQEQGKQAVKSKGNHRQQSSLFQNIENKAPENKQTLFVAGIGALRGKRTSMPSFGQKPAFVQNIVKEKAEEGPNIEYESEGFSVTTDASFLYELGKLAIKSMNKAELGIKALSDYILILREFNSLHTIDFHYYFNQYDHCVDKNTLKAYLQELKAKYWIAIALHHSQNYQEAATLLNDIVPQLYERKQNKKLAIAQNFLYEKFVNNFSFENHFIQIHFYPQA